MNNEKLDMSRRIAFYFNMRNTKQGPRTRLEENRHLPVSRRYLQRFEPARARTRATDARNYAQ